MSADQLDELVRTISGLCPGEELCWFADAYERARADRLGAERRILARLAAADAPLRCAARETLRQVLHDGHPALGAAAVTAYRSTVQMERSFGEAIRLALRSHPAWRWLREQPGLDLVQTGLLLSRLDIARAASPSAFWAYCGLETHRGREFRCELCGFALSLPSGDEPPLQHRQLESRLPCPGSLLETGARKDSPLRSSPAPRARSARFSPKAKKSCFEIGRSLLRADGGLYAVHYRTMLTELQAAHPERCVRRLDQAALRRTVRRFLTDLWAVWQEAAQPRRMDRQRRRARDLNPTLVPRRHRRPTDVRHGSTARQARPAGSAGTVHPRINEEPR
jgi:hypothetical protein